MNTGTAATVNNGQSATETPKASETQIMRLFKNGLTPDQIADTLGESVDTIMLAINSNSQKSAKNISLKALKSELAVYALNVLKDIMLDDDAPPNARVHAARCILDESEELPAEATDKLKDTFNQMRKVVEEHDNIVALKQQSSIKKAIVADPITNAVIKGENVVEAADKVIADILAGDNNGMKKDEKSGVISGVA